jgi:Capsule assembly protein Wzi
MTSRALKAMGLQWALCTACSAALAQPSAVTLPWTPSLQARSALHFLADEAQLPLTLSHWPLPAGAVREALQSLPADASPAVQAARSLVLQELDHAEGARVSLTVRSDGEALNGYGEAGVPGSRLDLRSPSYQSALLSAQLGLRADRAPAQALPPFQNSSRWRLQDAALATRLAGWNLQASASERWWGVGWQSSLVLSHNAPSMNALSLQRASARPSDIAWLSWAGPWSAEAFLGSMDYHITPADPLLLGTRVSFRPLPGLEVGLTKVTQTAGEGRPSGVKNLLRAFLGRGSNADTPAQKATDPGNSLGGFDLRWRCPGGSPCALYGQFIGEDQANIWPSKYLSLWGAEFWSADGRQRYFVEYSDSHCRGLPWRTPDKGCAYSNSSYPQGYTHANRWLGASQGPDSRLLSLGWLDADNAQALRFSAGKIGRELGNRVPGADRIGPGSLWSAAWQKQFKPQWLGANAELSPELSYTRFKGAGPAFKDWRAGLTLNWSMQ